MEILQASSFRFILALTAVLGLIALMAWLARRLRINAFTGLTAASSRLEVVQSVALDTRKRLVIVRRDDREHLLLIGPEWGQLIEGGIQHIPRQSSQDPGLPQKGSDR